MREHVEGSRPTPHVHVHREVLERNIDAMQQGASVATPEQVAWRVDARGANT